MALGLGAGLWITPFTNAETTTLTMAAPGVDMIARALRKAARTSRGRDGPWQSEKERLEVATKVCKGELSLTPGARLTLSTGYVKIVAMLTRRVEAGKRAWDEQYVYFLGDGRLSDGWMKASATLVKDFKEILGPQASELTMYLPTSAPVKPDSALPEVAQALKDKAVILAPERYYLFEDAKTGIPTVCMTSWKVGILEPVEDVPETPEADMPDA